MIAASEPLEFIPRGRQAAAEHPGPSTTKKQVNLSAECLLLNRFQNVNLSSDVSTKSEFWCIQEAFKHCSKSKECNESTSISNDIFMSSDIAANIEHELYVKGPTAVWTKGTNEDDRNRKLPTMCFTCDTPIRFAFFCSSNFFKSENPDKRIMTQIKSPTNSNERSDDLTSFGICLIDMQAIRVYSPCGEDFRVSLEFPVSNVWQTKTAILLEKNASSTLIDNQSISMPCLYSLSHPLNDMCPLLIKTANGNVNFLTEPNVKVVFTITENDLVMLYDNKVGKHFLCKLRKSTQEEKQKVRVPDDNDTFSYQTNFSASMDPHNIMHMSSIKLDRINMSDNKQINLPVFNRSAHELNSSLSTSKYLNTTANPLLMRSKMASSFNRSQFQSPYDRLQSSCALGGQTEFLEESRKIGQAKPSKPIVPEMCLECIWMENVGTREYSEIACRGFLHSDLVGQSYVCYTLPRSGSLMLNRLDKSNSSEIATIIGSPSSIPAKDAISINALKLIAVLAHCGTLIVYTGSNMIAKIQAGGILTSRQPNALQATSVCTSFPRRSSLLPTVPTESSFEDEVHLLSPVYPLQPQYTLRNSNVCCGLRDVAANRLTLEYPGNFMYRLSIPLLSECPLVSRCLVVLRRVLKKEIAITILSKWYGVRNAPGSQDLNYDREWICFRNFLLQLLGWPFVFSKASTSQSKSPIATRSATSEPNKRRKTDECVGSDLDFKFLQSHLNAISVEPMDNSTNLQPKKLRMDSNAILCPYIPIVFFSFHLLYEEMKIDGSLKAKRDLMAEFLNQLALDLKLDSYCLHYFLDFPKLVFTHSSGCIAELDTETLLHQNCLTLKVPNVFATVNDWLSKPKINIEPYPFIKNVNPMCKNIVELTALITNREIMQSTYLFNAIQTQPPRTKQTARNILSEAELCAKVLNKLLKMNLTRKDISRFPTALHYLLAEVLEKCRIETPNVCDPRAFELILRPELYSNTLSESAKDNPTHSNFKNENSLSPKVQSNTENNESTNVNNDGMAHIYTKLLRLRFPKDLRIEEVRHLLSSASPVVIDISQRIGVSDHDFIEEKEKQLLAMCTRTMALPIGRGMLTLQTSTPAATESFTIPKLCLSGKEKEKGGVIELQQIEIPQNMNVWPMFHNGVAAGLQLTSDCKDVDSTWIVYNKPKSQNEGSTEHAGFLMALGLNGHLKSLSFMSIYEYLVKCDEMTNLGLIMGISAAHRGTMDITTTKLLSVHIEALLPATALELDISQNIQVAAIMGIGLLYQETAKRHIAEVLLQEIGRPPGPEMENCVERESYALTAGLALGLVTLGKGESPPGLKDLQLPDVLHYYMMGGNKRPLTGSQKEKYKFQSFQVREGGTVNIDVTAPGATLALGLMFFKTGNDSVASWMNPPETTYLLDLVRPDLLLLRIIARGLILWDGILPTQQWLNNQFPKSLRFDLKNGPKDMDTFIDHEAICQAYCNIIAGGAFCIALRYAGTQNQDATLILENAFNLFLSMNGIYVGEYAGKSTVESCLVLILIGISLVNAGAGDLNVLRRCRMLRNRLGPTNSHVTYGSHMAVHMAVGFQFLGAGRFTISRSPQAIAALVCALFPKFPTHSNDNRYHLQAFRHLYVFAVEPRILLPRDIDSGKLCLCNVTYTTLDDQSFTKMAPCMLPELSSLASVRFEDSNYWLIKFERGNNWDELERVIQKCRCVDIKQKAGCLSHMDDPTNLRSTFAQTLTTEQYSCWKTHPLNLLTFSSDAKVQNFINKFLSGDCTNERNKFDEESKTMQMLTLQFYHCLTKDTMHALYIYVDLLMSLREMKSLPESIDIWQLKIIKTILGQRKSNILLSSEQLDALIKLAETHMETEFEKYAEHLRRFVRSPNIAFLSEIGDQQILKRVAALIIFFDIPCNILNGIDLGKTGNQINYMKIMMELKQANLNAVTTHYLAKLLNKK